MVTVTFRHLEADERLKAYAEEKFQRLRRYVDVPLDIHMVVSRERRHILKVDVMFMVNGIVVNAHEKADDAFAATDAVVDKLERRLTRYREKLRRYREQRQAEKVALGQKVSIFRKRIDAKPMDIEEAILQLKASRNNFILFRERENGGICLLYRRKDGNLNVIET
jgi:putative sigma-54 modulation protein